jgi:hypothetical protein
MIIKSFEEFIGEAKKPQKEKVKYSFTKISWDDFEMLSNDFGDTQIDGMSVSYALDKTDRVIGMWYTSKKVGSKVKPAIADPIEYSEKDPNWPW